MKEGLGFEKYTVFAKKKVEEVEKKDNSGSFTKEIERILKGKDSTKNQKP